MRKNADIKKYEYSGYGKVLGKWLTQGLEHTLTAEKSILLILLLRIKKFVWACTAMEQIVTYLLMVQKFTNLRL